MTTPKELADKAKRQADDCARGPEWPLCSPQNLHATIDQLQAMAEARQGEPVADDLAAKLYKAEGQVARLANDLAASRKCVSRWIEYGVRITEALGHKVMYPDHHVREITELVAARTAPQQHATGSGEPVASVLGLTRDVSGMCVVTVNGREAIRDNGDIINHYTAIREFAPPSAQQATEAVDPENDPPACEPSDWSPPAGWGGDGSVAAMARRAAQQATGSGQVLTDVQIMGIAFDERFLDGPDYIISVVRKALAAATQAQTFAGFKVVVDPSMEADTIKLVPLEPHRIKVWGPCSVCRHDRIPGEGCARPECPDAAPTTGKREPLTQQDIDGILHASREADEGPTALIRRVERAITGEQR
jgi:hypothetical protein